MLYTRSRKPGAMGSRPRRTRLQFEPLEPRSLLAADPIISEIMAVNDRTLADGDGDFPDWLELFNRGDMTVDLGGHYLTDSAGNLTKWQFPQADLGPGDFLLVFASGKQGQEIPAGEIHASFKLNSGGEYLALVDTDGTTVLSEFTPSFPPQEADTSHGESMTAGITALVSEGDSAKVLIPSQVDDDVIGSDWTGGDAAFDDSGWIDAVTGVGFSDEPLVETNVGGVGSIGSLSLATELVGVDFGAVENVRVVRVAQRNPSDAFLSLRELKALDPNGTNVASIFEAATPEASSLWSPGIHPLSALNDGIDNDLGFFGTTHTGNNPLPQEWLQVRLSAPNDIEFVHLYNRGDCCGEQATDVDVEFYADNEATQLLHSVRVTDLGPAAGDDLLVDVRTIGGGTSVGSLLPQSRYVLEINSPAQTSDRIVVPLGTGSSTQLDVAGELQIAVIGAGLAAGQTYQLLEADAFTGAFAAVDLPDLSGLGLAIDDAQLLVNGTVSIVAAAPSPTAAEASSPDLIGFWNFEGDMNDSSDGAFHGIAGGDADFSSNVPAGIGSTQSLSLDGSGDYVDLPINAVNPFDGTQDYTIAAHFNSLTSGDRRVILSSARGTASGDHAMAFFVDERDGGNLRTDNFFINQHNNNSTNPQNTGWHFGAVTYTAATNAFVVYLDDNATAPKSFIPSIPSIVSDTVRVGDTLNTTFPAPGDFTGQIDNLAIFSRALTPAELAEVREGDLSAFGISGDLVGNEVATDIETPMRGVNASAYVRAAFDIADQAAIDAMETLSLRMKYDDGFVAYLNGVEIARRNAPGVEGDPLAYDAQASAARPNAQAVKFETINITDYLDVLRVGANTLAIHGLNVTAGDSDFLVLPELSGSAVTLTGVVGTLLSPTPGDVNTLAVTQPPVFDPPGGTFFGTQQVVLSAADPDSVIRYTTNGSVPTENSTLYNGSISISSSTQIRAIAFRPGRAPSELVGEGFVRLASDVVDFTSNLPIVVLDSFRSTSIGGSFIDFHITTFDTDAETGRSVLSSGSDLNERLAIKKRGASSSGFPKPQYRIEVRDQNDDDLDLPMLGMPAEADWVLNGPWSDKSLIRNSFAYDLGNNVDMQGMRTRHVELFLNDDGGDVTYSDYVGVYVMTESIKRGDDRVDIPVLDPSDTEEPDITGGYLIRFENGASQNAADRLFGWNTLELVNANEYTQTQRQWISDYVNAFDASLFVANWLDPVDGYRQYIDVDSFVNLMMVNELLRDQDSYTRSNYLYKDRGELLTQKSPLWDYNLTTGVGCCHDNRNTSGWQYSAHSFTIGEHGWFPRLVQDPDFLQQMKDRWHELRQTTYSLPELFARIDAHAGPLAVEDPNHDPGAAWRSSPEERNFQRWNVLGQNGPGFPSPPSATWEEQIDLMKDWLTARVAWIDSQLIDPPAPVMDPEGGIVAPGTPLTITGIAGQFFEETPLLVQGDAALAFVPVNDSLETGAGPFWYEEDFVPVGWTAGTSGVGYEDSAADYASLIGTNVLAAWNAAESSVYSRFEFNVDAGFDADDYDALLLRMKYDDGFVAYLNGQRVEDGAGPVTPNWQSNASSQRDDGTVTSSFVEFDITTEGLPLLHPGVNVLAVQGLNIGDTSSDLLILPELYLGELVSVSTSPVYFTTDGSDPRGPGGAIAGTLFTDPISINESQQITARTRVGNVWSAPTTAQFTVEVPLRITEVNYHPANPSDDEILAGFINDDDFEFIELMNVDSGVTLDLGGYSVNGINFTFAEGTMIGPQQRIVIARNLAAFEARWGAGIALPQEYRDPIDNSNRLDNNGETLTLRDAGGGVVHQFRYEQDWYPETDGFGFTLIVIDTEGDYSVPSNWRSSALALPGGSPGVIDPNPLAGDINGDGAADRRDAAQLIHNLGRTLDSHRGFGDLDGDRATTLVDLALMLANQNAPSPSPQTVAAPRVASRMHDASRIATDVAFANMTRHTRRDLLATRIARRAQRQPGDTVTVRLSLLTIPHSVADEVCGHRPDRARVRVQRGEFLF